MTAASTQGTAALHPPASRGYGIALGALFFLSGALGLLYEIVWFRRLHLALGVSLFAVGAVVAAFMLGLALGSRWAASSMWLRRAPLLVYALLELGIATYALCFPLLVLGLETLYPLLFRLLEAHPLALAVTRFVLAFVLLLPPTFLMGASLPAMAEAVVGLPQAIPRTIARLYALNTLGGVVGTLATGFFLIERLGIVRTLYVGAVGSGLIATAAYLLARHPTYRRRLAPALAEPHEQPASKALLTGQDLAPLAATAALVAGAVSLASEIVWTRALVFYVHNSTYAFSAIVAVYLLGIGAGALVATRFVSTTIAAARFLALALGASALSLILAIGVYRHLPELAALLSRGPLPAAIPSAGGSAGALSVWTWERALAIIFGQVAAVLFLPALLLGSVFPLTLKLASASGRPAQLVGRLYAFNALGSVLGTVMGTFVLVALLGTRGALIALAWLPLPIALWAMRATTAAGRTRTALASVFVALLAGGTFVAAPPGFYQELFAQRFGKVLFFAEGITETVAVCEHKDGSRWIQFSDGRGASGTWSFQGGWLYAHVPLLLHPRPEAAAVICFGTGNTLGAASLHPLRQLDGIELSPAVVKAAPLFAQTNHDVATNNRVRIVIEDGRSFMLATDRRYDVIAEEPPLVHTAGVVNLYSRDFYELCARRLNDDGIMAVWLATWELEPAEMRMLVRAFVDAFPHASLWDCTHPGEWLLIGSKTPLRVDLEQLTTRMAAPAIARDLARIDADLGGIRTPADLLSLHLMGRAGLVALAGEAQPVTDDRSVVDFTTPRHARANFGLGEWVTGGLVVSGVGARGLQSESLLRDFDRVYAFREPPDIASYGSDDPQAFSALLRATSRTRELKAARLTIAALRRSAAELRALDQRQRSLESLEHGLTLVPEEASAPIHTMMAQLYEELGRTQEARTETATAKRLEEAQRTGAGVAASTAWHNDRR
jgi:spermidine synthase